MVAVCDFSFLRSIKDWIKSRVFIIRDDHPPKVLQKIHFMICEKWYHTHHHRRCSTSIQCQMQHKSITPWDKLLFWCLLSWSILHILVYQDKVVLLSGVLQCRYHYFFLQKSSNFCWKSKIRTIWKLMEPNLPDFLD